MRKKYFAGGLAIFGFLCALHMGSMQAVVVWSNGVTPDVLDDDLDLSTDTITLQGPGPVSITATNVDINVNMTNPGSAATIQGQVGGNSRLYFNANNGHTITVNLTKDLIFQGSSSGAPADLLVVFRGLGKVVFNMDGGATLTFTKNGTGGAVQAYAVMGLPLGLFVPTVLFQRDPLADPLPNDNVEVIVEQGSIFSYLSTEVQPSSTQEGDVIFDTTNENGSGRSILTIGDASAVIVRGRLLVNPSATFTLADIDPATPAGFAARFITENASATTSGSLLVQNYNNTLGEFVWDPWENLGVRTAPPFGTFSGQQYGFIVGSFGILEIGPDSYLDYVGLSLTTCPTPAIPDVDPSLVSSKVKARSGSALFTDAQPSDSFIPPLITIQESAGIYFRSGIDSQGNIRTLTNPNPFTIDPQFRTAGAGVPVFDIEGVVNIIGANTSTTELSMFQLLSLEVAPTGGPLFADGTETIFPLRTFATNSITNPCTGITTTPYITYNNACFLNNGRANLLNVSWEQTDQNHLVFDKNDITSEPAYIGGETWLLENSANPPFCMPRPLWAFVNSRFNIHTSVALTGVDLLVPNGTDYPSGNCIANISQFFFYQNGQAIDNGTGREMVLGTYTGSTACNGCTVISKDAELNVMQTAECVGQPTVTSCSPLQGLTHQLLLETAPNTNKIVQGITSPAAIANQYSIQTIYLGNNSNITVGSFGSDGFTMDPNISPQDIFPLTTCPDLVISGDFFSFETRGGENGRPDTSNITGQGGIFVDTNGTFEIGSTTCRYLANMGTMVTKSANGIINLPKNQVFFDPRVGIANWNLDMNDPNQVVIIPEGSNLSDYTLNWQFTLKNYDAFSPYVISCLDVCSCPAVTTANVTDIPTIQGTVQQLQLEGSRLGDPAHILIDGGIVEEMVMLGGCESAAAPVAVVVLQNEGTVGLGTAHRNIDSTHAEFTLGVNGVNLILNSSAAKVVINEDMIINNVCSILPGPGIAGQAAKLTFTSDCCNTLRITKDGVLDLSMFDTNQVIEFAGNLNVVFDPGARVILNDFTAVGDGPALRWSEHATCTFNPIFNTTNLFSGSTLANTDPVRVIFTGQGRLEFIDFAQANLPFNAFVGIEALPSCSVNGASIILALSDSAEFYIGNTDLLTPGGALQVGNTATTGAASTIFFTLNINGPDAKFEIGPQGFFGAGVGIVSKGNTGHNSWQVAPTANVSSVFLNLQNGIFRHAQIFAGDDVNSSLLALCDSIDGNSTLVFSVFCDPIPDPDTFAGPLLSRMSLLGGGNFIAVSPTAGTFNPIVLATNGIINANYAAGLLTSNALLQTPVFNTVDAFEAQLLLRLQDIADLTPVTGRGVAGPSPDRNNVRVAYVDRGNLIASEGLIARLNQRLIAGTGALNIIQQSVAELGAIGLKLVTSFAVIPRPIADALQLGA